MGKFGLYLPF